MAKIWEGINISKQFRQYTALEQMSISFEAGECTSLCGGNGAGKSTLIRMIADVMQPSSGHIMKSEHVRIGYMPDALEFPSKLTAKEFLSLMTKLKRCEAKEVAEKLEQVGLSEVANKPVKTFSKGMQQRLLLAQALVGDPEILLLDEPSNGLDPFWVRLWKQILLEIKTSGQTIIFSSHVLHDVMDVADRVVLFNRGKIIDDSPVHVWKEEKRPVEQMFFEKLSLGTL